MLAAFLATVLFASAAVSGRRLSYYLSGTLANLIRLSMAAVLLGIWAHLFGNGIEGVAFPILFLSGCVGFGLGDLSMFQAFPRIGARRTTILIQCLAAPFAVLMEWAWLGVVPGLAHAAFGAIILAGVGTALFPRKLEAEPAHGLFAGIAFGILAALCQAGGAVLSRKAYAVADAAGQSFQGAAGGVEAAYQRLLGGILVSLLFYVYLRFAHRRVISQRANWPAAWPWLLGNGLAGPALGVTCYQWALMAAPTNIVLPIVATTPLVVIPIAAWVERERITVRAIIGGVVSVAGVIGLTLSR